MIDFFPYLIHQEFDIRNVAFMTIDPRYFITTNILVALFVFASY